MNPFEPAKPSADQTRTIEDLVKIGVVEYLHDRLLKGAAPTDDDLLVEARRIVNNADQFASLPGDPEISWFRDLIMLSGTTEDEAPTGSSASFLPWAQKLEMIAAQAPHATTDLETIPCSKQRSLMAFVKAKQALGLTPTDRELQVECCKILDEIELTSNYKCKAALEWFKYLIGASTCWLREFRRWAGLPRSSEMASEQVRSTDDKTIDYSIHNHARLEKELRDWTAFQLSLGRTPSDADLQQQARLIVYKNDDPWNQTAIDDPAFLHLFKRQNGLAPPDVTDIGLLNMPTLQEDHQNSSQSPCTLHFHLENFGINLSSPSSGGNSVTGTFTPTGEQPLHMIPSNQPSTNTNPTQPLKYFLNDANCYGRLVRELTRFVTTCTSPNNPNQHVCPSFPSMIP
jgi:Tc5 transposase DNA-binding domain